MMRHGVLCRSSLLGTVALALLAPAPQAAQAAQPETPSAASQANASDNALNPSLWGYSGLLNVPDANILRPHSFYTGLRYFPSNSGLSGVASMSILDDLEASLIFGIPPADGFSALAASVKYRIMDQADKQPLSLAVGASLLGLGDPSAYVPGSNAFISLSRGIDWEHTRILNLHGGFMGGLKGARLFAGLDVPIMDLVRLKTEYLGVVNGFQALNFGVTITPHPDFAIELAFMQQPTFPQNFWDRDFSLGVSYRGDWGALLGLSEPPPAPPTPSPTQPNPVPTPQPTLAPPATEKGQIRVRVIDREQITAVPNAQIQLKSPRTGLTFTGQSNALGEYLFSEIPVDNYEVRVEKAGWNPEVRLISVQSHLETFFEIALSGQDAVLYGSLEIPDETDPAQLELDLQDLAGHSLRRERLHEKKYRLEKVPPGSYQLVVYQGGDERLRLPVEAKGNQESQYDLSLPARPVATPEPQSSASAKPAVVVATVEGQIKQKDAGPLSSVRLELKNDDLLVITLTSPEGKYIFRDIPRGVYTLTLSKDGFKKRIFQLTINETKTLEHNFEMEPGS